MKIITVIDGDTCIGLDRRGVKRRLRLKNIDCPELDQKDGPLAKQFVHKFIAKKRVGVRLVGRDRYRRFLAHVQVEGADLATALVREGLAYPTGGTWSLRLAGWGARLRGKGVHGRWGATKPWQHRSKSRLVRALRYWLRAKFR